MSATATRTILTLAFLSTSSAFGLLPHLLQLRLAKTESKWDRQRLALSEEQDDEKNLVTVAVTQELGQNEDISEKLRGHPILPMLGLDVNIVEVPCVEGVELDGDSFTGWMNDADVVCFGSSDAVKAWLHNVDVSLGIVGVDEEEKTKMGNGDVVAVCESTETANTCLQSKRWESRDIYYPKLDLEEAEGVDAWADSAVQSFGDVMERKFWGGGW